MSVAVVANQRDWARIVSGAAVKKPVGQLIMNKVAPKVKVEEKTALLEVVEAKLVETSSQMKHDKDLQDVLDAWLSKWRTPVSANSADMVS